MGNNYLVIRDIRLTTLKRYTHRFDVILMQKPDSKHVYVTVLAEEYKLCSLVVIINTIYFDKEFHFPFTNFF